MTAVKLNHEGVDVLELRASATDSNEIHFTAKHNLFNADLSYVFAVTDLNVDCSSLPIFPPDTDDVLFTIKKRHLSNAGDGSLEDVSFGGVVQRFQVSRQGKKYFDVASFMSDASNTAYTFSKQQDEAGVVGANHGGGGNIDANHYKELDGGPFNYLNIGFDAGGRILFEGVSGFWNNFVIEFSPFAIKLFHLQDVVGVTALDNNKVSLTMVGGAVSTQGLYIDQNNLRAGGILTTGTVVGKNSVLKFLDSRLFLTVETHLPIERNLRVNNGVEETDASIVRVPFLNRAESTIYSRENTIADEISLTTKSYVGRVNFVSKTQPILKWNLLTSSYEQRIFRFQLYCIYNVFAAATGFRQTKIAVPLNDFGEWDLSLRFVSKI